jgi:hypothetical protein
MKSIGLPSYMSISPIPFLEASHSRKNIFVRLGRANIGFMHTESFKEWKYCSMTGFQVKAFF